MEGFVIWPLHDKEYLLKMTYASHVGAADLVENIKLDGTVFELRLLQVGRRS